jgi:plasmid stability protein
MTLTLKGIPDAVYKRLKASAETNRRSLNNEAIVCLEAALLPAKAGPSARIGRARVIRAALSPAKFKARDIEAFKKH